VSGAPATTVPALRCAACGSLDPGPRELCPACLSPALALVELPGEGRLVAWTMIRRAPTRFRAEAPYAVCVVDLDAGVRVTGRLAGATDAQEPGTAVRAVARGEGYSVFEGLPA